MKRQFVLCGVLLAAALVAPAQQNLSVQVQLHYTGSGTVNATHKIFVALWDSPDLNGPPADIQSTTAKNGIVTFTNVKKSPVYASAAYDPTGHWDGASGPPPTGSS